MSSKWALNEISVKKQIAVEMSKVSFNKTFQKRWNQYTNTRIQTHIYYILFAWLLTLRRHSKIIKICAAWTWHIFSLSSVCECASIYLCVSVCVWVCGKSYKTAAGPLWKWVCCNTVSAKLCWRLRNLSKHKFSGANTKNKSIGYANYIYVWTTYINMYKYLFTRE